MMVVIVLAVVIAVGWWVLVGAVGGSCHLSYLRSSHFFRHHGGHLAQESVLTFRSGFGGYHCHHAV
jgi:hypothetical protein